MAKKKSVNVTGKTMDALKDQGYIAEKVEQPWNQFSRVRKDLFGGIDILAIRANEILGIQATAGSSNHSARKKKILGLPKMKAWLESGAGLEIWTWRKVKVKHGGKAERWEPRIEEITLEDFSDD